MQLKDDSGRIEKPKSRNHEKSPVPSAQCVFDRSPRHTGKGRCTVGCLHRHMVSTIILPAGPRSMAVFGSPCHHRAIFDRQHRINLPTCATSQTLLPCLLVGSWSGWMDRWPWGRMEDVTRHPSIKSGYVHCSPVHAWLPEDNGCVPSIGTYDARIDRPGIGIQTVFVYPPVH